MNKRTEYEMSEGERMVAVFVGGVLCLSSLITLVFALWHNEGRIVSMMVMGAITAGWLFRFGLYSK